MTVMQERERALQKFLDGVFGPREVMCSYEPHFLPDAQSFKLKHGGWSVSVFLKFDFSNLDEIADELEWCGVKRQFPPVPGYDIFYKERYKSG